MNIVKFFDNKGHGKVKVSVKVRLLIWIKGNGL